MRYWFLSIFLAPFVLFSAEENFILTYKNASIIESGDYLDEQVSPCCSFNIVLSLMGYDSGNLQDEEHPVWPFVEGYDNFLETWKAPQTPKTWLKHSCVWYSRVLAAELGSKSFEEYLKSFDYGNHDASGGLTTCWLNASLLISPREQAKFIQDMMEGNLKVSEHAVAMTRNITYLEELPNGWRLHGKTGWTGSNVETQIAWFVGWIEKGNESYCFAYNIRDKQIDLKQRVRVKELLAEAGVLR